MHSNFGLMGVASSVRFISYHNKNQHISLPFMKTPWCCRYL